MHDLLGAGNGLLGLGALATGLTLTIVVLAITALISKAAVWAATASADFIASLAEFRSGDSAQVIFLAALAYFGIAFARSGGMALRHLMSTTLHRNARRWLISHFDREILSDPRIALDLMSDRGTEGGARLPDLSTSASISAPTTFTAG